MNFVQLRLFADNQEIPEQKALETIGATTQAHSRFKRWPVGKGIDLSGQRCMVQISWNPPPVRMGQRSEVQISWNPLLW